METLHRFQDFSLSYRHFSLGLNLQFALSGKHRFPPRLLTLSASSSNNSRVTIAVKPRKPVKSNADLCTELREFLSMAGLPQGHVPSFKELLHHGRNDLAYLVRRRGYKLITELLSSSTEPDTNTEMSSAENQKATNSDVNESVDDDLSETSGNKKASVMNTSTPTSKLVPPHETCRSYFAPPSDEFLVAEEVDPAANSQKDLDVETSMGENEDEINHLKAMLDQKEMELYQLKEQVEKEKLALSTLQAKAEEEISKVQEIMSSKDEELQNTEESLSGLKEVQIEYWGHGETVEVAGSFNGWHHRIQMHSPPFSTSVGPNELRKSRLWSTVLWLYPGIYEIKFVVDGHWVTDSRRESVTRGTIHNNILRVDR